MTRRVRFTPFSCVRMFVTAGALASGLAGVRAGAGEVPFSTPPPISVSAPAAQAVSFADVDGDGDQDVLSASSIDDKIAWYENVGGPGWVTRTISLEANGAQDVRAADLDRDGDVDVISASVLDGRVAWYQNVAGNGSVWVARTIRTRLLGRGRSIRRTWTGTAISTSSPLPPRRMPSSGTTTWWATAARGSSGRSPPERPMRHRSSRPMSMVTATRTRCPRRRTTTRSPGTRTPGQRVGLGDSHDLDHGRPRPIRSRRGRRRRRGLRCHRNRRGARSRRLVREHGRQRLGLVRPTHLDGLS